MHSCWQLRKSNECSNFWGCLAGAVSGRVKKKSFKTQFFPIRTFSYRACHSFSASEHTEKLLVIILTKLIEVKETIKLYYHMNRHEKFDRILDISITFGLLWVSQYQKRANIFLCRWVLIVLPKRKNLIRNKGIFRDTEFP